jgi:citrate lyase beta subunit
MKLLRLLLVSAIAAVAFIATESRAQVSAFTYQGRMVDLPVVDQARLVLSRHAAIEARGKS